MWLIDYKQLSPCANISNYVLLMAPKITGNWLSVPSQQKINIDNQISRFYIR